MKAARLMVERNPDSELVCAETARATEVFWSVARLEEASLWQKARFSWPEEGVEALGRPVSGEEIQKALFSMKSRKAPGPDGFSICYLPSGVNSTVITLIPKRRGAERMEEFRPISCCNIMYKCISRISAERLQLWLPDFISDNQSTFFPGMPLQFVSWVRACVTLPKFSMMINGSMIGVNVWATHLVFADDLMIFCVVERNSLEFMRQVLIEFTELSGLVANVGKSSMFVAGVESGEAEELAAYMGVSLGSLPVRYLGLPLLAVRLRAVDCAPLIQRITARIRSWAVRSLSFAGRLQLVRSVLQSFQVFWCSIFVFPACVTYEVDRLLRSYLWNGSVVSRGGARVVWDEVCLPLGGGLGVKHVASWNQAAIMKLL
ncbi:uncharacterized protein LOC120081057 [Benincasa hispida]|uniref:uncharacterized protein LOC120081057 n=1 Tax=Benincasa hispida TaxID=102211 RepID=UPI0019023D05|nr:uncharacterized protein LOC120081057 [Benincasa hispida]